MALLDFFLSRKKNTANIAKERLQIIVAERRRVAELIDRTVTLEDEADTLREQGFRQLPVVIAGELRWSGFRPALGYGAGVRWRSPIGPLRLDLARADAALYAGKRAGRNCARLDADGLREAA